MKQLLSILAVFVAVNYMQAQPPKGKAKVGTVYGSKVDPKNAVPAAQLPQLLANKDTADVKVKGEVRKVCANKGCWMTLKINDSTEAFVKMKDYGFFVPLDLIGKNVVLEGKSFVRTTSVSELKHYAEDSKKPQSEIDAITQPKNEIRLLVSGIVVTE